MNLEARYYYHDAYAVYNESQQNKDIYLGSSLVSRQRGRVTHICDQAIIGSDSHGFVGCSARSHDLSQRSRCVNCKLQILFGFESLFVQEN